MICGGPLSLIEINKEKHSDDRCDEHYHDNGRLWKVEGDIKENNDK